VTVAVGRSRVVSRRRSAGPGWPRWRTRPRSGRGGVRARLPARRGGYPRRSPGVVASLPADAARRDRHGCFGRSWSACRCAATGTKQAASFWTWPVRRCRIRRRRPGSGSCRPGMRPCWPTPGGPGCCPRVPAAGVQHEDAAFGPDLPRRRSRCRDVATRERPRAARAVRPAAAFGGTGARGRGGAAGRIPFGLTHDRPGSVHAGRRTRPGPGWLGHASGGRCPYPTDEERATRRPRVAGRAASAGGFECRS
jgi:hypothetical protein